MTTAVLVTNVSLDADRGIEFRPNNPGAQGYEIPWSTILPGLSACVIVDGATQLEVREGGTVPEGYTPPRPGVLEVEKRDDVTEVTIGDSEIIVINGIRFQGIAFTFLAEDANVGKVFRLDSNADGVVQVTELHPVPEQEIPLPEGEIPQVTADQRAIEGATDSSPVVDSGPGETLPGAAMLAETSLSEPDLTIHPEADAVGLG